MKRASMLLGVVAAVFATVAVAAGSAFAAGPTASTRLQFAGTTTLAGASGTTTDPSTSGLTNETPGVQVDEAVPNSGNSAARVPSSGVPTPAGNPVTASGSELLASFAGLSHFDERTAGTGIYANTQFSLEPPDQALCAGGGKVIEGVNDAFRVYNTDGTPPSAVQAYNQFFNLGPAIIRSPKVIRGIFLSDPKCIYDAQSGRFVMSILEAGEHAQGGFDGTGSIYFAVSDPNSTTSWSIYHFDTSHDGVPGDPTSCPCLGDQPLLGADANGIYFTVNSFPFFANGFNGAWVYAISKAQLYGSPTNTPPTVFRYYAGQLRDGIAYSLAPATVPSTNYDTANLGTEDFLSALDFNSTLDNQIAHWRLTNTVALQSGLAPTLQAPTLVDSEVYGQPPASDQSTAGSFFLLENPQFLGETTPVEYHVAMLNSNDDRMETAVYANGKLWGALNTVVKTKNGPTLTGLAYFVVDPASERISSQGYVSANQENLLFPSLGVNDAGKGVIGATIVGPDMHPSTAYARIDATNGAGALHIAGVGPVGEDGFTGYTDPVTGAPVNQKGVARWGDYGAAAVDSDGTIWVANETTANVRTLLANWGTWVVHVTP